MKKIIILITFVIASIALKSQSNIERISKAGFKYFSIPEKKYKEVDSIRFIVSSPINPQNPTIIFLHGSGNTPLISYISDTINFHIIPPFSISSYLSKYNFVSISKPATPICRKWIDNPPLIDTSFADVVTFAKMDFLDYYVSQTSQVVDYLRSKVLEKNSQIYLIGNSQGGSVAIRYTFLNPKKIQKLILYSSGVLDLKIQEVYSWRQLADAKKVSAEEAQKNIDAIYQNYISLKNYYDYFKKSWDRNDLNSKMDTIKHYNNLANYTYNYYVALDDLLKINIPILCVYGTDDLKCRDNDMLPLFFAREKKSNLTMLPILNCNHLFVETTIEKETGKKSEKYIGDEVFSKIEKWLFEVK
jgi:pimeloyl-ACP methyl ester carboxylesterase